MSKMEYENLVAFHPGYYIKEVLDELEITQEEFATRLGVTGKTLSQLLNGKINLSNDVALKLSIMLGTSTDVWLNLQQMYIEKCLEIKEKKQLDEEIRLINMIDYHYFVDLGLTEETQDKEKKVKSLCSALKVSSLKVFLQPDFLVNYRSTITDIKEKNILNSNLWLETAISFGKSNDVSGFDAKKLYGYLDEIRGMTVQKPNIFMPRLREILSSCGVSLVLLPSLKNAGVHGAVKWVNSNKVILAMSDRNKYADRFWFSFFHELKHVLQQKIRLLLTNCDAADEELETEADQFARDWLITPKQYEIFTQSHDFTRSSIIHFANEIGIHPGIIVGRLQNEKLLGHDQYNDLKEKYTIQTSFKKQS